MIYVRLPSTDDLGELRKYRQRVCELLNNGNHFNTVGSAVTGAYTITGEDYFVPCNGTFTVTLPSATNRSGYIFIIKNIGTGTITLDAESTETIDNQLTIILAQYDSVSVISDGTEWWII